MKTHQPDPKPRGRLVDWTAGYEKLRSEQRCRLCGERFWRGVGLTRHHVLPRGQGGDDIAENIVPLCGDGTRGCHAEVEHDVYARSRLRGRLRSHEVRYVLVRTAEQGRPGWIDQRYPLHVQASTGSGRNP